MLEARNLIFIHGKGGVGRTTVSQATARMLSERQAPTLLVTIDTLKEGAKEIRAHSPTLSSLNIAPADAFEEYILRTVKIPAIAKIFAKTSLIRALSKVAPGVRELVTLGKIWDLRSAYRHVVVDLPSSGYGLAMFHSMGNFMKLFGSGKSFDDAKEMLKTFSDPQVISHWIVTLPEEMPLIEASETLDILSKQFPRLRIDMILNQRVPRFEKILAHTETQVVAPQSAGEPLSDAVDYLKHRVHREQVLVASSKLTFSASIEFVTPSNVIEGVSQQLANLCIEGK